MSTVGNISQSNAVQIDGRYLDTSGKEQQAVVIKRGSTIQGSIVSISDTEDGKIANINIGDAVISAKLADGMGLKEGQTLSFSVKGASSKGITLLPLLENTSTIQSTLKALSAAGLEANDQNIKMVTDMMEAGLSIDKNSLQEMARHMANNPGVDSSTLVEMKSLNIPITENNITQFENYKNYEHQVIGEIADIIDELPSNIDSLFSEGKTMEGLKLYGDLIKQFAGSEQTLSNAPSAVNSGEVLNEGVTDASNGMAQEANALMNGKEKELLLDAQINAQNLSESLKESVNSIPKELAEFADKLRNVGISDDKVQQLIKDAASGKDVSSEMLKELSKAFENADLSKHIEVASWKNVFTDNSFKNFLKDKMSSDWLIKPEDVNEKENVENLYQRINSQVKTIVNAMNEAGLQGTKAFQAANSLQNNLDFMNQINQMFQYVQLPLLMNGQNTHGDLYVYRNKNKRMSEDGSVSAILHLDMDNLGPVDVYVKMIDMKVTTNFYVADDSILDLINDNIHILNERLEKRGYTMQVKMQLLDDFSSEDAAVDEMFDVTKTPILSTASFDARA